MRDEQVEIRLKMSRTLADTLSANAPRTRSKFILTLIDSYYQSKPFDVDLYPYSDPTDDYLSFSLRLPKKVSEELKLEALRTMRTFPDIINYICAHQTVVNG